MHERCRYLLAKELSSGEVRPATTSEVEGLQTGQQTAALMGKHALQTPPSVTSNKPKVCSQRALLPVMNRCVETRCRVDFSEKSTQAVEFA